MARHPLAGLIPVQPDPDDRTGLLFVGGSVTPPAILEAYRHGIFPWTGAPPVPWCSPDPRALLAPGSVVVRRSLAKRLRNGAFTVHFDRDLPAVMAACRDSPRPGQGGTWITPNLERAWGQLFEQGWAHSVEVFEGDTRVGGLYGLAMGAAFFGESMFHTTPDASKVALVALARRCAARGDHFIDCQAMTPHLERMGARPVPRAEYLRLLAHAMQVPTTPGRWTDAPPLPAAGGGAAGGGAEGGGAAG